MNTGPVFEEALRETCKRLIGKDSGAVAQLGERSVRNAEVEGSIPFRSTKPRKNLGRDAKHSRDV